MISTHLTGNFGDQFVRYALARTVAEKNGYSWGINKNVVGDYLGGKTQLDFFNLDYGFPNDADYNSAPPTTKAIWIENSIRYATHNFYEFQPDVFSVADDTHLRIYCGQDARYYEKEKLRKWFSLDENIIKQIEEGLYANRIILDENMTIINCRGGEYRGVPDLFLQQIYYDRAIDYILKKNPKMKFMVITDDVEYYKKVFVYPVYHFTILGDYYIVNHAKNLIISNSGFALFPVWLNENKPNVIAPKHWARHNIGVWANSSVWTFGQDDNWTWLDKDGNFSTMEFLNE
jgi:hypothetical protein